jgi:hypothetical protein
MGKKLTSNLELLLMAKVAKKALLLLKIFPYMYTQETNGTYDFSQ